MPLRVSRMKWLMPLMAALALPVVAMAQDPLPLPDALGHYRWRYVDESGQERAFEFIPTGKIAPRFEVSIQSQRDGRFAFVYAIANGPTAGHAIENCVVEVGSNSSVDQPAAGWRAMAPPTQPPRAGWFVFGATRAGIEPGARQDRFILTSTALPGVTTIECGGRVRIPSFPRDLPQNIRDQVETLHGRDSVLTTIVGPIIEPDGDPLAVLQRVNRNYQPALVELVPEGRRIAQLLQSAQSKRGSASQLAMELRRIQAELVPRDTGLWMTQLFNGLSQCLSRLAEQLERPQK